MGSKKWLEIIFTLFLCPLIFKQHLEIDLNIMVVRAELFIRDLEFVLPGLGSRILTKIIAPIYITLNT